MTCKNKSSGWCEPHLSLNGSDGIRTQVRMDGHAIKFEIVRQARILFQNPGFCLSAMRLLLLQEPTPVGNGLQGVYHAHRPRGGLLQKSHHFGVSGAWAERSKMALPSGT